MDIFTKKRSSVPLIKLLILFLFICHLPQLQAQPVNQIINQVEQDKARQKAAKPQHNNFLSQTKITNKVTLNFPEESVCLEITRVVIINTDEKFDAGFLTGLTNQAQNKCLGDRGIHLLENAIQNELISRGYITTLIYFPRQDLYSGTLTFQLVPGKIGKIAHSPVSDGWSSLANNLPLRSGDILRLSDLEQGAANLQRIPDVLAKIQLLPGSLDGESDIYITHKQDKYWQLSGWMNDAGSRNTGHNQGGVTFYLYNPTSLNDIFYISLGRDLAFNNHNKGNQNTSIYYSIPWGYWWLDLYTSRSRYLQTLEGNWSQWKYRSHYEYSSVEFNRMLSRTMNQKTSVGLQLFKGNSRFYLEDTELQVMQKENPGWKLALRHQHSFPDAATLTTIGFQNRLRWLGDANTAEQKNGLISKQARIFTLDSQALVKFAAAGPNFSYAPHFNLQVSPDVLTTQNKFTLGNRWTVRGFDGEKNLIQNQGWYFSNDFNWSLPGTEQQLYLGLDIGCIIGASDSGDSGRNLTGSVIGLRGEKWRTNYNLFASTPLSRPDGFITDDLNLGFSLQWNFRR